MVAEIEAIYREPTSGKNRVPPPWESHQDPMKAKLVRPFANRAIIARQPLHFSLRFREKADT